MFAWKEPQIKVRVIGGVSRPPLIMPPRIEQNVCRLSKGSGCGFLFNFKVIETIVFLFITTL